MASLPAVIEKVDFPAALTPERVEQIISKNFAGFQRLEFGIIRVPSGKNKFFEASDSDDPIKEFQGIIVDHHPNNVYFSKPFEQSGGVPPDCYSIDGKTGIGHPGGSCLSCPLNQYGSGPDKKGKACANRHRIYVLQEGCYLPDLLNLPVMSVQPFVVYVVKLGKHGLLPNEVLSKFSLEQTKNRDGIDYSKVKFSMVGPLSDELKQHIAKYTEAISKFTRIAPTIEEYGGSNANTNGEVIDAKGSVVDDDSPYA